MKFRVKARNMNFVVSKWVVPKREIPASSGRGEAIINPAIPGINHFSLLFSNFSILLFLINVLISFGSPFLKKLKIIKSPIIVPVAPINEMTSGLNVLVNKSRVAVAGTAVNAYPKKAPAIKTPTKPKFPRDSTNLVKCPEEKR